MKAYVGVVGLYVRQGSIANHCNTPTKHVAEVFVDSRVYHRLGLRGYLPQEVQLLLHLFFSVLRSIFTASKVKLQQLNWSTKPD